MLYGTFDYGILRSTLEELVRGVRPGGSACALDRDRGRLPLRARARQMEHDQDASDGAASGEGPRRRGPVVRAKDHA